MVFASTVRFTTNTALTGSLVWGFVGWVGTCGYIVSLAWVSPFFGVLLVCCVGGFSEGVTPSILSEPGS